LPTSKTKKSINNNYLNFLDPKVSKLCKTNHKYLDNDKDANRVAKNKKLNKKSRMLGYKVFVSTKQIYNLVTCTLSITNTRRYPTHCCGDCREFEIKLN